MSERVLVVEDEEPLRRNLVRYLEREGHIVRGFASGEEALEANVDADVAIVDLRLPGMDGITLASTLVARAPDLVVIAMTAYGSLESVIDSMRAGVHDYLVKPVLLRDVARKVSWVCEHRRLARENAVLRIRLSELESGLAPIARSRAMEDIMSFVGRIASTNGTVLIEGESGSGKEVIARAIHDASPRASGPFLAVNTAAIPPNLLESQLFGHERGAFTGAAGPREGLFRAAAKGTLFLDEIGDMPLAEQAKLLRAVETKEVFPVGSDRPVKVECRLIAATNAGLAQLVEQGKFRRDLFYRLNALGIRVPPLRERVQDIPALAQHFLRIHGKEHKRPVLGFDGEAMLHLLAYRWPGNVRELSNVVERATLLCDGERIGLVDLPSEIGGAAVLAEAIAEGTYQDAMAGFERQLIAATLRQAEGDRREAARKLGISLATLYRRIDRLDLGEPAHSPDVAHDAQRRRAHDHDEQHDQTPAPDPRRGEPCVPGDPRGARR